MSTSERATAKAYGATAVVKPMKIDPTDRDQLREAWRLAAAEADKAHDDYMRAKDGKQIFYSELVGEIMAADPGMKQGAAERLATTSDAFKDYINTMHEMRRRSSQLKLTAENADRLYWECVSQEATARKEMGMTR